ncbi:hypothetical protein MRB53_038102 [Persea americana]|nr:hypothetical protein MRB53_038102 [Persea americana]
MSAEKRSMPDGFGAGQIVETSEIRRQHARVQCRASEWRAVAVLSCSRATLVRCLRRVFDPTGQQIASGSMDRSICELGFSAGIDIMLTSGSALAKYGRVRQLRAR